MIYIGSGWTWINSVDCRESLRPDCDHEGGNFVCSYVGGTVYGRRFTTDLWIPGNEKVKAKGVVLNKVYKKTGDFLPSRILGMSSSPQDSRPNFLEALQSQNIIKEKSFAIYQNPKDVKIHSNYFNYNRNTKFN